MNNKTRKRTPLISLIAMMIAALALATTACEKKTDQAAQTAQEEAEIAALDVKQEAAQAALVEALTSGTASPEEIKKLEKAVTEIAVQQETIALAQETRRRGSGERSGGRNRNAASTETAPEETAPAGTAAAGTAASAGQSAAEQEAAKKMQAFLTESAAAFAVQAAKEAAAQAAADEAAIEAIKAAAEPSAGRRSAAAAAPAPSGKGSATAATADEVLARAAAALEAIKQTSDGFEATRIAETTVRELQQANRQGKIISNQQFNTLRTEIGRALDPIQAADPAYQAYRAKVALEEKVYYDNGEKYRQTLPAGWNGPVLTVGKATARRGEQVTLKVHLQHSGMMCLDATYFEHGTRLRLDTIERYDPSAADAGLKGIGMIKHDPRYLDSGRHVYFEFWSLSQLSDVFSSGYIVEAVFTVLPDATLGETHVTARNTQGGLSSTNGGRIPIAVVSGSVTVVE